MKKVEKFTVTKADQKVSAGLVDAVISAEICNIHNARTTAIAMIDPEGPFMQLANFVRQILESSGKKNLTPAMKSDLSLDQLNDKAWAMIKLMTTDHFEAVLSEAIQCDNPNNYSACMAVDLAGLYNWCERWSRANEMSLSGGVKDPSAGKEKSRAKKDQAKLATDPMTKDEIVALLMNATSATDKKVILEALKDCVQLVKASTNPLDLPATKVA